MNRLCSTALLIAALTPVVPASATSYSIDNSDLWWVSSESGWGMQLVERDELIFATLFVYNNATAPIWYTATLTPSGPSTWSGDLLVTSGPWFATVPFNPVAVTRTTVGTMSFTTTSDRSGTLNYSVDGVNVTKTIARQTLKTDDYSGGYFGLLYQIAHGCPNPIDLGGYINRIDFDITQSAQTLTILSQQQGNFPVCQSTGAVTTYGQLASSQQVISSCTDGSNAGNVMAFSQIVVTPSGITINFTAPSTNAGSKGCNLVGSIYGIRH